MGIVEFFDKRTGESFDISPQDNGRMKFVMSNGEVEFYNPSQALDRMLESFSQGKKTLLTSKEAILITLYIAFTGMSMVQDNREKNLVNKRAQYFKEHIDYRSKVEAVAAIAESGSESGVEFGRVYERIKKDYVKNITGNTI